MKNNIKIISASAGSGKTYRLSQELESAVTSGRVRPEAVLATTFTKRAAAELQERVRTHLLRQGRTDDAQRLTAARIGTVNSVCSQLVREFSFELRLSPVLRVLDAKAADYVLQQAMSSVLVDAAEIWPLSYRFGDWDWQADIRVVVSLARSNGIKPQDLVQWAQRSKETYKALLMRPHDDGKQLDESLKAALATFLVEVAKVDDTTKVTEKAIQVVRPALLGLEQHRPLKWSQWAKLASLGVGKRSQPAAAPVRAAAGRHDIHPRLHTDIEMAIDCIFDLAARTLQAYQVQKSELGVIDFTDQETYALDLLGRPEIQSRLRSHIDLVLVDEFQDTSPIQLAIFLRLAAIAPESIWVGDQKQAIFSFRGTDPALMDAAIAQVLGGAEPDTLSSSWRSRPALVQLTSDLFAPPFAARGIPEQRTRLNPHKNEEPAELGHVVECWKLDATNKQEDADALASALTQVLADPTVQVRDPETSVIRSINPSDVAVLCKKNNTCTQVADAVKAQGIHVLLQQCGLTATLEGRVALAGLGLWVDSNNTLAAAELARITTHPDSGDEWLSQIVKCPGEKAFADNQCVKAILEAKEDNLLAGPLEVLDMVISVTKVIDLCRRWGDAGHRLANVEALRCHTLAYIDQCDAQGAACTPNGLLAYFESLKTDALDHQGIARDQNAITISTWHASKGLEWPVTVLFELNDRGPALDVLGVNLISDAGKVDLKDPLAERWIRYWPFPYDGMRRGIPLLKRLEKHAATERANQQRERELLRLLYVGWTRARDRVVLAGRQGKICVGTLQLLDTADSPPATTEPDGNSVTWAGRTIEIKLRSGAPATRAKRDAKPEPGYPTAEPRAYPEAFIQPSATEGTGAVGVAAHIGERIKVRGDTNWEYLGNALHGFLAGDRSEYDQSLRERIAVRLLRDWSVSDVIEVADLLGASDRLNAWIGKQWPECKLRREWPLNARNSEGSIIRGQADLVLETAQGNVLIDHKSFPGSLDQATSRAVEYAGQLSTYAAILTQATEQPLRGVYIHLPISGLILPVEVDAKEALSFG